MDFLEILAFLPQPSGCEGQAAACFPRIFSTFSLFWLFSWPFGLVADGEVW
jgi:hypothetical protein